MATIKLSELPPPVVEFKKLRHAEDLPDPYYASHWAAGIDLHAAIEGYDLYIPPGGQSRLIPTGLIMAIPQGYEGQVRPRSGLAAKYNVTVLNTPGTIDADYRGEIQVILINHHRHAGFMVKRGDRIAQLVIAPVTKVRLKPVDVFENTERGAGGFGSSGVN